MTDEQPIEQFKYWEEPDYPKHEHYCGDVNSDPDHCVTCCANGQDWLAAKLRSCREDLAKANVPRCDLDAHCACAVDRSDDICMRHHPAAVKLREELAAEQIRRVNNYAEAARLISWVNGRSGRQPAMTAFTEGPERQVAYAVEDRLVIAETESKILREDMEEMRRQAQEFQKQAKRAGDTLDMEREKLALCVKALKAARSWMGQPVAESCGACGTPNATCNSDCVEAAQASKDWGIVDKALAAVKDEGKENRT